MRSVRECAGTICLGVAWVLTATCVGADPTRTATPVIVPSPLSVEQARTIGLRANRAVQAARLRADRAWRLVDMARGTFDPRLFVETAYGSSETPSEVISGTSTNTDYGEITAGARQRIATGTEVELSTGMRYREDRADGLVSDPWYTSDLALTLRQDLLRDAGLSANRADVLVAENESRIAELLLREVVIENTFHIEKAYWDLYFAIASFRVSDEQLKRALKLVDIARAQVDAGVASPIEITRARSSAANQAVNILAAKRTITMLRHALLGFMGILEDNLGGMDFELADEPAGEPVAVDQAAVLARAVVNRPDIAEARWRIRNAVILERYAKNQKLPRLQVYGRVGLLGLDNEFGDAATVGGDTSYHMWEIGLAAEWPVPNRTARANHAAAHLARQAAEVQLASRMERATREVADAVVTVHEAADRMSRAEEARRLAQSLLESEEKSFSLGRTDSLNVLNAQASLAAATRDVVLARTDHATALAALRRVQADNPTARSATVD